MDPCGLTAFPLLNRGQFKIKPSQVEAVKIAERENVCGRAGVCVREREEWTTSLKE
jgi:hypothetical protein